jgi:hypothetical protein
MEVLKNIYLKLSYIIHMLCEWFLCIYAFIIVKKYDIFYALYIFLLIVLKLIFKYECIINFFDKKIINPEYELGSEPDNVPYKKELYGNNLYLIFFINCFIILNLFILIFRNQTNFYIRNICLFNIIMWIFIEYKTQDYSVLLS